MHTTLSVPVHPSLSLWIPLPVRAGQLSALLPWSLRAIQAQHPTCPFGAPCCLPHPTLWAGPSPLAALPVEQKRVVEGEPHGGAPPERPLWMQVSGTDAGSCWRRCWPIPSGPRGPRTSPATAVFQPVCAPAWLCWFFFATVAFASPALVSSTTQGPGSPLLGKWPDDPLCSGLCWQAPVWWPWWTPVTSSLRSVFWSQFADLWRSRFLEILGRRCFSRASLSCIGSQINVQFLVSRIFLEVFETACCLQWAALSYQKFTLVSDCETCTVSASLPRLPPQHGQ